ncbi:hypothetical protein ACOMHN_061583 [Nucella lapillus]
MKLLVSVFLVLFVGGQCLPIGTDQSEGQDAEGQKSTRDPDDWFEDWFEGDKRDPDWFEDWFEEDKRGAHPDDEDKDDDHIGQWKKPGAHPDDEDKDDGHIEQRKKRNVKPAERAAFQNDPDDWFEIDKRNSPRQITERAAYNRRRNDRNK